VTISPGLGTLPEGGRVDFDRLRAERRRRLVDAMRARQVDVLLLGRPANLIYAAGVRQLWTAGARPWGPGCVVVAGTGRVHLMSTWDEGVPAEIPRSDLFGLSWNPAKTTANLKAIPGLSEAHRIGTDGLSVGTRQLVAALAPTAELVDGAPVVGEARSHKTADEVACLVTAAAAAEAALSAMVDVLRPGISERQLLAVAAQRLASLGAPVLPSQAAACALHGRLRRTLTDRAVGPGELVALTPAASFAGYEGSLSRTWLPAGSHPSPDQRDMARRCRGGLDAVVEACRPGTTGADLLQRWEKATGSAASAGLTVHGVGLGVEPPLIGDGVGAGAVLAPDTVVAVQSWVAGARGGGFLQKDLVHVTTEGPRVLTRFSSGPVGGDDA